MSITTNKRKVFVLTNDLLNVDYFYKK